MDIEMDRIVKDCLSQFRKPQLLDLCKELGVLPAGQAAVMVEELRKALVGRLNAADEVELSDLAFDFAVVSEIVNEDGEMLEDVKVVDDLGPIPDGVVAPECFTYAAANEADPSCQRCKILRWCHAKRLANRPKCFGNKTVYNPQSVECQACLEHVEGFCQAEIQKRG